MTEWIDAEKQKPKALERVLVSYVGKHSRKPSISVADYIPPNTVRSEDFLSDECEPGDLDTYSEADDTYYVNENWFEALLETEMSSVLPGRITHWAYLPQPPEISL